jgi:predicted anti-sigma-YlaC factor YlaD
VTPCRDYDVLLSLRAAGALDGDEAARLDAHLPGCAACRAGLDGYAGALALARLPAVSETERAAASGLAVAVVAESARRVRRRHRLGGLLFTGLSAAAVIAAVVVGPSLLRGPAPPAEDPALLADAGWQEPDLDEIWETTNVIDWGE